MGEGDTVTLNVSNDLLRRQVTLIGSWTFSTVGQADCARYVADRGIDLDRLFTHRWKLEQAEESRAAARAARGESEPSTNGAEQRTSGSARRTGYQSKVDRAVADGAEVAGDGSASNQRGKRTGGRPSANRPNRRATTTPPTTNGRAVSGQAPTQANGTAPLPVPRKARPGRKPSDGTDG